MAPAVLFIQLAIIIWRLVNNDTSKTVAALVKMSTQYK